MRTLMLGAAALSVMALAGGAAASPPQTLPGFIDTTVVPSLDRPTAMAWDPDGRLYVSEQPGRLRVIRLGRLIAAPFITLDVNFTNERGLLGVAVDPDYTHNHYIYLYYTVPATSTTAAHNRVSRFTSAGDTAVPGSEQVLIELPSLGPSTSHNGGAIHFGPDGKLYIALGDNNQKTQAQSMTSLLGKILRINSDGTIPTDNPFYNTATGIYRSIWALGFRNPFTFAFQYGSRRMYIDDVGQDTWEEIDEGKAGGNYGWPVTEGPTSDPRFISPVFAYGHGHTDTLGCAITGGAFANGPVNYFPAQYVGKYYFVDYCSQWVRAFDRVSRTASMFETSTATPVDVTFGRDGSLYYLSRQIGVHRISWQGSPTISQVIPSSAIAGKGKIRILGTYLAGATSVTFNGTPATFTPVWDTWLDATVPYGATTGKVAVTTAVGTFQTSVDFTVSLTLTGLSPAQGPAGTPVDVTGNGFTGATAVSFNGTPASFTVQNDGLIQTTVPPGAISGPVLVTTPAGTTQSATPFTVQ